MIIWHDKPVFLEQNTLAYYDKGVMIIWYDKLVFFILNLLPRQPYLS
jgi:hypothetical protein